MERPDEDIMASPSYLKILKYIAEKGEVHSRQVEEVGIERPELGFRLSTLEHNGFVEGEFKIINSTTAARVYRLTSKAKTLLGKVT